MQAEFCTATKMSSGKGRKFPAAHFPLNSPFPASSHAAASWLWHVSSSHTPFSATGIAKYKLLWAQGAALGAEPELGVVMARDLNSGWYWRGSWAMLTVALHWQELLWDSHCSFVLSKRSFGLCWATETWRILSAQRYAVIPIRDGALQLNWATHHVWNFSYVTGRNEPRSRPAVISGDTPEINIPHWDAGPDIFAGCTGLYFQS